MMFVLYRRPPPFVLSSGLLNLSTAPHESLKVIVLAFPPDTLSFALSCFRGHRQGLFASEGTELLVILG